MSATDTIFCRWELAVTDDIYIRIGSNIGAQTYNTYQNMQIKICTKKDHWDLIHGVQKLEQGENFKDIHFLRTSNGNYKYHESSL